MSKKKKKNKKKLIDNKNINKNISINKNNNSSNNQNKQTKKILDGVDLGNYNNKNIDIDLNNNIDDDKDKSKINIKNKLNINEKIQSFISILFTIIIFMAFILLIYVLYDNYLKKDNKICNKDEVCKEFIKKDYNIKEEDVSDFLIKLRGIIYNIDNYDNKSISNDDYLKLSMYLIWNTNSDYIVCNHDLDKDCLITKKEVLKDDLYKYLNKYFGINNPNIVFNNDLIDNEFKLYELDNKVVLSFNEFEYETLKHDIINIDIDSDNINIIYALSRKIEDSDLYTYIGYKNVKLKYDNNSFIIKNIETVLNSNK